MVFCSDTRFTHCSKKYSSRKKGLKKVIFKCLRLCKLSILFFHFYLFYFFRANLLLEFFWGVLYPVIAHVRKLLIELSDNLVYITHVYTKLHRLHIFNSQSCLVIMMNLIYFRYFFKYFLRIRFWNIQGRLVFYFIKSPCCLCLLSSTFYPSDNESDEQDEQNDKQNDHAQDNIADQVKLPKYTAEIFAFITNFTILRLRVLGRDRRHSINFVKGLHIWGQGMPFFDFHARCII